MNCDECKHYNWYYDHCDKWNCEVDAREVHNCFEPYETPILDAMIGKTERVTGSKVARATPFASQWQNGNVDVVIGEWNEKYFAQLESFPEGKHDDMVDASSDAFNEIAENKFNVRNLV